MMEEKDGKERGRTANEHTTRSAGARKLSPPDAAAASEADRVHTKLPHNARDYLPYISFFSSSIAIFQ